MQAAESDEKIPSGFLRGVQILAKRHAESRNLLRYTCRASVVFQRRAANNCLMKIQRRPLAGKRKTSAVNVKRRRARSHLNSTSSRNNRRGRITVQ